MEEKQKIIVLWKEEGETPLGCIERARREGRIPQDEKATYAGRLDPMAEGVLLVLVGDGVYEKDEYLKLSKEYKVEVLIGVSSDTGDILGIVEEIKPSLFSNDSESPRISSKTRPDISESFGRGIEEKTRNVIQKCIGEFDEPYPMYSSRTVEGEPLFAWARKGEEVDIPTHRIKIDSIALLNIETKKLSDLEDEIISRIEKVSGDFRQTKIIEVWKDKIAEGADAEVVIAKIKVSCESGAYMRVLAEKIARGLGFPGLAYRIIRTKLGTYGRNS